MQEPASHYSAGSKYLPAGRRGAHTRLFGFLPLIQKVVAELAEGFEPPTL